MCSCIDVSTILVSLLFSQLALCNFGKMKEERGEGVKKV